MTDDLHFQELPDDDESSHTTRGATVTAATPDSARERSSLRLPTRPIETFDGDDQGNASASDDEDETWWTPSELRDLLNRAKQLKDAGNAEFGQGRWEMAIESYREGLAELPATRAPPPPPPQSPSLKGKEKEKELGANVAKKPAGLDEMTEEERADLDECQEMRAILSANIAACFLKLKRWKEAVTACDEALESRTDYVKALHRRATANEAISSWGSLQSALDDWNTLDNIPEAQRLLGAQIPAAKRRLPDQIKVQQEKEKDEMLGKLKDLGNMVLGKFGLSTDNFKMQEQPGGGYGLSFQK